jgi:hypothetical protein
LSAGGIPAQSLVVTIAVDVAVAAAVNSFAAALSLLLSEPATYTVDAAVVVVTVASAVSAITVAVVVTADTIAIAVITAIVVNVTDFKTVSVARPLSLQQLLPLPLPSSPLPLSLPPLPPSPSPLPPSPLPLPLPPPQQLSPTSLLRLIFHLVFVRQ